MMALASSTFSDSRVCAIGLHLRPTRIRELWRLNRNRMRTAVPGPVPPRLHRDLGLQQEPDGRTVVSALGQML